MAIGDDYSNNKKENKERETFSYYNMSNMEGTVDPSMLSIKFWNGLMKVSILPPLQNQSTTHKWDKDNAITAYLSHTKARTLAWAIDSVLDPNKPDVHSAGINTSSNGLITFSDGKEVGLESPCLIIRKIDEADGHVISSYIYEFKINFNYAIVNFNPSNASHEKVYFESIEVEQFRDLLREYYQAMTNATAYSVVNLMKYDMSRINTKLNSVCESLGITYEKSGGNYSKKSSGDFFSNNSGASNANHNATSRSATIEDIDDALGED